TSPDDVEVTPAGVVARELRRRQMSGGCATGQPGTSGRASAGTPTTVRTRVGRGSKGSGWMDVSSIFRARQSARRRSLQLGIASAAGMSLPACDALSTEPAGSTGRAANNAPKGKEAPALTALVKEGKLPPLEERLPKNPVVVEPVDQIGVYGGTWRSALP